MTDDDTGYQEAGDHEEDIDPDKSAAETRNAGMIENHCQHRDGA